MMTDKYIKLGSKKFDVSQLTLPESREFRDAWYAEGSVVKVDPAKKKEILKVKVKEEAHRRIIAICPEWKQRNLIAQASILAEKGRSNWTAEELSAWDAGEVIWSQIASIRAASDDLEAMTEIPEDYAEDKWWV